MGTHDVTILNISSGIFECLATNGCTRLGGCDFDNRILRHLAEEFKRKSGKDIMSNPRALRRLLTAAERAKCELSAAVTAEINVDNLMEGIDFTTTLSRARFDELCSDLFRQSLEPLDQALRDAKLSKSQIDEIILIGGSSRIPRIKQLLSNYFNGKKLNDTMDPATAVAEGAAIQAAILSGVKDDKLEGKLLLDVCPLSIGIETAGQINSIMIPRNTTIPTGKKETFSTFSDNQTKVVIKVLEGERKLSSQCNVLGTFDLDGIAPAPRGTPKIEVSFDISADGILSVTAVDTASSKKNSIEIKSHQGRLTPEEIEAAIKDAEKHKADDEEKVKIVEVRNQIFAMVNNLSEDKRKEVVSWLDANPSASLEELETKMKQVMEMMKTPSDSGETSAPEKVPTTSGVKIDEVD